MKKIRFGAFPLSSVDEKTRQCVDTYSIKSYANLITLNTQMTHIQNDTQSYITPELIKKYFEDNKTSIENSSTTTSSEKDTKITLIKRAFNNLKAFNKAINENAFYRDIVTYPIYIEHTGKDMIHDYDFLLLTNDLFKDEVLREIHYDDKLTLIFLFLKTKGNTSSNNIFI